MEKQFVLGTFEMIPITLAIDRFRNDAYVMHCNAVSGCENSLKRFSYDE